MRFLKLLSVACVLALLFAGCFAEQDHEQEQAQSQQKACVTKEGQQGTQSPEGGCNPPLAPNMVDSLSYGNKEVLEQAIAQKQSEINAMRAELQNPRYNEVPPPVMPYVDAIRPVEEWIDNFHKRIDLDLNDPENIAEPFVQRLRRKHERQAEEMNMLNEKLIKNVRSVLGQAIQKVASPRRYDTYGEPLVGLKDNVGMKDVVHNTFDTANTNTNINKTNAKALGKQQQQEDVDAESEGSGSSEGSSEASGSSAEDKKKKKKKKSSSGSESSAEESSGEASAEGEQGESEGEAESEASS